MSLLDEAVAAAGVDPRELHARLTAAQPDRTIQLARAFARLRALPLRC